MNILNGWNNFVDRNSEIIGLIVWEILLCCFALFCLWMDSRT